MDKIYLLIQINLETEYWDGGRLWDWWLGGEGGTSESSYKNDRSMDENDKKSDVVSGEENELRPRSPIRSQDILTENCLDF